MNRRPAVRTSKQRTKAANDHAWARQASDRAWAKPASDRAWAKPTNDHACAKPARDKRDMQKMAKDREITRGG